MKDIYEETVRNLYDILSAEEVEACRSTVLNSLRRAFNNYVITDEQYDSIKELWETKK